MHETACRLEHAIDDDLEVALTVLLGNPMLDPSGRDIPKSGEHLQKRVQSFTETHVPLSQLASDESGTIQALLLSDSLQSLFGASLSLNNTITSHGNNTFKVDGNELKLTTDIAENIIVKRC